MTDRIRTLLLTAIALTGLDLTISAQAQQDSMSFFVTSVGKRNGADLGGLAGARSGFGNATAGSPASAMNSCAEPHRGRLRRFAIRDRAPVYAARVNIRAQHLLR